MKTAPKFFRVTLHIGFILALFIFVLMIQQRPGQATVGSISTQGASSNNNQEWTNPANAHGTADDNIESTITLDGGLSSDSGAGDWAGYDFDTSLPLDAEIKKVEVIPQYHLDPNRGTNTLAVTAIVSGSACSSVTDSSEPTSQSDFIADLTSCRSWTRNDLLDANFETRITATNSSALAASATFHLDRVRVRITYDTPDIDQSAYRVFANTDSTDVGAALGAQNTAVNLPDADMNFRVRMLGHVSDAPLPTTSSFKLQYVGKGVGSCAVPSGGTPSSWTDVTAETLIAFNDNAGPADDDGVTANASDPVHNGHTNVLQSYQEANNANVVSQVADGEDAIWDFSLKDNDAPGQTPYCLRMVTSSGGSIGSYSQYAEVTTFGELAVAIVNSLGNNVSDSTVQFDPVLYSFDCNTTNGTLGINEERIRIANSTQDPQWSLNIAASLGSTTSWSDGSTKDYDYNDPNGDPAGCEDGSDDDSLAGQLSFDPSQALISPEGGCASSGISLGSASAFEEGVIDSITLVTASSSTALNCYWDITGIDSSQTIPPEQTDSTYDIEMTLTLTAT